MRAACTAASKRTGALGRAWRRVRESVERLVNAIAEEVGLRSE